MEHLRNKTEDLASFLKWSAFCFFAFRQYFSKRRKLCCSEK